MLANARIVYELLSDLNCGDDKKQANSAKHVRDLCSSNAHYREAFVKAGCIPPLVGLLDDVNSRPCLLAAQALSYLAPEEEWRLQIRECGGLENLINLVCQDKILPELTLETIIMALHHFANDVKLRDDLASAGLLQALVKLMQTEHCEEVLVAAATLMQHMAWNSEMQDRARMIGVLTVLVKKIQHPVTPRSVVCVCLEALVVYVVANADSQDEVRFLGGIPPILKQLQLSPYDDTTSAATDALRAICQGSDTNKVTVRKEWGIPLLVLLLAPTVRRDIVEKAVDCLRILTTMNEDNRSSLMGCQSALPSLTRLMEEDVSEVTMERACAVIANITSNQEYFVNVRESGIIQKLVRLLDKGPESKLTEMATVALSNLMADPHSRTALRLAGGVPPLIHLIIDGPTRTVQQAAETALDRLEVSDTERNAILGAFRYAEQRHQQMNMVSLNIDVAGSRPESAAQHVIGPKPLTRYTPQEVCSLFRSLCMPEDALSVFLVAAVTGGELLEITQQEVVEELGWTKLQAKKIRTVQSAFKLWTHVTCTPGTGELTFLELHQFLQNLHLAEEDVLPVVAGFREHVSNPDSGAITFQDFTVNYHWFTRTLEALGGSTANGHSEPDDDVSMVSTP